MSWLLLRDPSAKASSFRSALPARVKSLAATTNTSTSRVMVELIESGLAAREQEKRRFFELAERLSHAKEPKERKRLKEELGRMTFGD